LVQGLRERDVLRHCDGVLSGYVGSAEVGAAILEAVAEVKRANPNAVYCCDPVIGDVERGAFVKPEVADFMCAWAVPAADIVTPNHFELEQITGHTVRSLPGAQAAFDVLRSLGPKSAPKTVLVTSLVTDETPAETIDLAACDETGRYRLRTPKLPVTAHGAGDAIAALFMAHYLRTGSAAAAMSRAAASIFGILKHTAAAGGGEMALIEAQDELVNPSASFVPEPL
jgi:pyridoxine kinase